MKNNKIKNKVILACSLAALGLNSSQAITIISTGSATRLSADSDISTNGTLISSINFTGSNQTVNGVTFSSQANSTGITFSSPSPNFNTSAFNSSGSPLNTLSTAYRTLVVGAASNPNADITVDFSNLVVGQAYELQVFAHDPRGVVAGDNGGNRSSFVEIGGSSVELDFNGDPGNGGVGEFVIFEFTAGATTESLSVTSGNSAGTIDPVAQFNALQLRAVPEPSSVMLLGLGAFGVLLRRKRI